MKPNPYEPTNKSGGPGYPPGGNAREMVQGPAIGIIVAAIIGILLSLFGLVINLFMGGMAMAGNADDPAALAGMMASPIFNIVGTVVTLVLAGIAIFGALKMRNLESYGLSLAAAIITILPCSTCCLIGIPIGIWAVIVLAKPEVKAAFVN